MHSARTPGTEANPGFSLSSRGGDGVLDRKIRTIDDFVLNKVRISNLPGLSLAIIKDEEVVHKRGFGHRDLESGFPATSETLYGIGSITKSFTCLAIMQLQERGQLDINDEVGKHLDLDVRPFGEPVRIKHLMSHTSGIPALAYAEAIIRKGVGDQAKGVPIGDVNDMVTFMRGCEDWAHARPGERWFYLNEGYVLLGGIIEKISGQPYTEYVNEHILEPLRMRRSFFSRQEVERDHDAARPYMVDEKGNRHAQSYLFGSITADGGLISSVEDMARYVEMYLSGGRGIVSEASLKEMMMPRVDTPPVALFDFDDTSETLTLDFHGKRHVSQYGYGLGIDSDFFGRRLVAHGGSVLIATGQMSFLPDEGWGVMLLANGSGYPLSHLAQFVLAIMLDEDADQLAFRQGETLLERFQGVYETYQGTYRATVRRTGDFLEFATSGKHLNQKVPLIPEKITPRESRFFTLRGGTRLPVEFVCRENNAVELIFERYKLRRVSDLVE